jgi:uncharacterized protein (DUF302 family)
MQTAASDVGIVRVRSCHSVSETTDRLTALLKARGVLIFAHIRFSYDAARAGFALRPEELLIFGSPRFGAPLLQARPTIGLDLPSKALVWEDSHGRTWIAYNDPEYLRRRYALPRELVEHLTAVIPLIRQAAEF